MMETGVGSPPSKIGMNATNPECTGTVRVSLIGGSERVSCCCARQLTAPIRKSAIVEAVARMDLEKGTILAVSGEPLHKTVDSEQARVTEFNNGVVSIGSFLYDANLFCDADYRIFH